MKDKLLVDMFYEIHYGMYPFKDDLKNYNKSIKAIEYFNELGLTLSEIVKVIDTPTRMDYVSQQLPEEYYKDSLLTANTFYYHRDLRLNKSRPKFSINSLAEGTFSMALEMKIHYTLDDLINYFYSKFNIYEDLKNRTKDLGSIKYLLQKYESLKFVQPVDFILTMIDLSYEETKAITNVLDITVAENNTYVKLKALTDEYKYTNANKIIWRQQLC